MSGIKKLLWDSVEKSRLMNLAVGIKNKEADYEDDIYLNLEYPGLIEFIQFFSMDFDSLQLSNDEKYYSALYHFYKNTCKKLPSFVDNPNKLKEKNLRGFLIEVFFETFDGLIQKIPNTINNHPEEIEELINWEEVKKEYPLAAKSNYHLLHSKTFLESVKKEFLSDYCSKDPDFRDNIMEQIKDIKDPLALHKEFIETLADMVTSSNMIKIFIEDYLLFNLFNRFYLDNEKKKIRLNQKNDKAEISDEEKRKIFKKMMNTEEIEQVSNINLLDDEQKNTIDEIIQKFDMLGEKEKKKIKKYIIRLAVNKKPFKVQQFLKNNNLTDLPSWVIWLLDDLSIDIIENDGIKGLSESEDGKDSIDLIGDSEVSSAELLEEKTNKELIELFSVDPVSAVIEKAKLCNYDIENENLLRKQIETICLSSKLVKDSLLFSLLKNTFSRPILKNSWAYSLRAWGSGYRFVLRQNEKKKFIIVWFYNHDDYENVIDSRKW